MTKQGLPLKNLKNVVHGMLGIKKFRNLLKKDVYKMAKDLGYDISEIVLEKTEPVVKYSLQISKRNTQFHYVVDLIPSKIKDPGISSKNIIIVKEQKTLNKSFMMILSRNFNLLYNLNWSENEHSSLRNLKSYIDDKGLNSVNVFKLVNNIEKLHQIHQLEEKKLIMNSRLAFVLGFEKILCEEFNESLKKSMKTGLRPEFFIDGDERQVKEILRSLNLKKAWGEVIKLDKETIEKENGEFIVNTLAKMIKMPVKPRYEYETELMLYSMHQGIIACNIKDYQYIEKNKQLMKLCVLAFRRAGIVFNYYKSEKTNGVGNQKYKIMMDQDVVFNSKTSNQLDNYSANSNFWKRSRRNLKCMFVIKSNFHNIEKMVQTQDVVVEINKNIFQNKTNPIDFTAK